MVLGTCRRILGDPHDAADAFQATFLLLVRKAATIRRRESVGDWLFRIARRVAVRRGGYGARRRRIEELAATASVRGGRGGGRARCRSVRRR